MTTGQIRHRRISFLVFIALGVVLLLAGCSRSSEDRGEIPVSTTNGGSASTPTSDGASVAPRSGGTAIVGEVDEPTTLNSFLPGGSSLVASVIGQTYAAGVQEISGTTLELIPELVTEIPTTSNGGVVINDDGTMTVTYAIRDEASWNDGLPISGSDFQFTLDTILDPGLPISKTNYEDIVETIVGPKSFAYTMAAPTVRYDLMFSEIIPKHAVEGSNFISDWNDARWPSAGPFVFNEWIKGESITVLRNAAYWKVDPDTGTQLPYLDEVTFRFFEDSESVVRSFEQREVDVISPDPTSGTIETLKGLESSGVTVEVLSGPVWEHANFQFGPGRLERNASSCGDLIEMRLAVVKTIDRQRLVDELFGGLVVPLPSYVDAFVPAASGRAWERYVADHEAAAEHYANASLIADTECSVVFSTTGNDQTRVAMSTMLAAMFAESGIPFEVHLLDGPESLGATLADGTWDVGEWAWASSPGLSGLVGIHDLFDPNAPLPKGSNFYRWGTPDSAVIDGSTARFAEVREAMNQTLDEELLIDLVNEAEAILADSLVFIPLYSRPVVGAVWTDEIGGYKLNPSRAGHTWNIEFWYRVDL
jgi:peptide/nickel transport system substrate-binding protein